MQIQYRQLTAKNGPQRGCSTNHALKGALSSSPLHRSVSIIVLCEIKADDGNLSPG